MENTYTLWLVEPTFMINGKRPNYYHEHPIIFRGDKKAFDLFMELHYPNAIQKDTFGTDEEQEQFRKFRSCLDSEGYPTIAYLQLHISTGGWSGYLLSYLLEPLT